MTQLRDKTVWITGASSGIGEALAYEMAQAGAKVILSARHEKELQRVRENCVHPGIHVVIPFDLENYHVLEDKANEVLKQHGPIDLLINNGGISQRYLATDALLKVDEKIMHTNFLGTIALTRPVLKGMLERNSGHIVTVSSILGFYGMQTRSAYSASKHALRGYFESLRNELAKTEIKITMVYPGYVKTQISTHALLGNGSSYGKIDRFHLNAIPPEKCAEKIKGAIELDKPELIVAGLKERFGLLIMRFLPAVFRFLAPRLEV